MLTSIILKLLENKEIHPTSVNVLYLTNKRPIPTLATSEGRPQYVTPHQTTTSNYQQTTVFTSHLKKRRIITNQTTHSIALDGYIIRGMYNETKTTSLSMRRFKALRKSQRLLFSSLI